LSPKKILLGATELYGQLKPPMQGHAPPYGEGTVGGLLLLYIL
jgi:hypothetical protein